MHGYHPKLLIVFQLKKCDDVDWFRGATVEGPTNPTNEQGDKKPLLAVQ